MSIIFIIFSKGFLTQKRFRATCLKVLGVFSLEKGEMWPRGEDGGMPVVFIWLTGHHLGGGAMLCVDPTGGTWSVDGRHREPGFGFVWATEGAQEHLSQVAYAQGR